MEQIRIDDSKLIELLIKASQGMIWQCPKCLAVLGKQMSPQITKTFSNLVGTNTCSNCGTLYSSSDVYEGKYDVSISGLRKALGDKTIIRGISLLKTELLNGTDNSSRNIELRKAILYIEEETKGTSPAPGEKSGPESTIPESTEEQNITRTIRIVLNPTLEQYESEDFYDSFGSAVDTIVEKHRSSIVDFSATKEPEGLVFAYRVKGRNENDILSLEKQFRAIFNQNGIPHQSFLTH